MHCFQKPGGLQTFVSSLLVGPHFIFLGGCRVETCDLLTTWKDTRGALGT